MDLVDEFLKTLNINKNETLIVAVSYGPDSMALLHHLNKFYSENKIICAHVHHNHRKESDCEAKMLEEYCKNNNIIFEMMKIKRYKNDKFTEVEAREKRYSYMYSGNLYFRACCPCLCVFWHKLFSRFFKCILRNRNRT